MIVEGGICWGASSGDKLRAEIQKKECRKYWIIAKISRNNGRHTRATNSDDFEFLATSLKFATVVKLFRCEDAVITIMVHKNGKTKTV